MLKIDDIQKLIIDVPDFPKKGIVFKDITPILENPEAFISLSRLFAQLLHKDVTKILCIESRGFILGSALSQHINVPLVLVRKPGKLPRKTIKQSFSLEYGEDTLEIHEDSVKSNDKVVIIDDVLATGGTCEATIKLCEQLDCKVIQCLFLMEIETLNGRDKINSEIVSLLKV